jgi:hypothetical protein
MLNLSVLKKDDFIKILTKYYADIGRENPPKYHDYSLNDFKKCIYLFRITPEYINKVLEEI